MRFKKLSFILSALIATTLFAGCGNSSSTDSGKESSTTVNTDSGEEKVLKIAALEGGRGVAHWEKLVENFEESHEGVKVELTTASNLEEVIRPQIQGGNIPDLIYLATGRPEALTETFINEQALHDLTNVMNMTVPGESVKVKDKILDGFLDTSSTSPYGDGKTYLAPLFYSPTGLFYNKGLFEEKGYDVPKTWDEFFALGDKAKADGIYLFAYPTAGYFDSAMPAMLAASGGIEGFNKAMNYEEGFWTSEEATRVLETFEKLKDYTEPSVVANANGDNYKKNQQLILDNKALFLPNGDWLPGEMADAPRADGFEWGFTAYPAYEEGGDMYSYNFFEQMYIPAEASNIELAEEFMAYLYSDEAVGIIAELGKSVVPVEGAIEIASQYLDDLQIEMLSVYENGAKPVMGGFAATEPIEGLVWNDSYILIIDSIMNGTKTVEDWQNELVSASDRLREAIIK
ncbi:MULTISPECIES: carbohydrate ABC transporter substrate-binding protein [Clostridia]|jgi:N-acetylglucosamine transport system substrate-binding protein|uniref:Carbohydrate ABC transporter substrate-binding protein n=1 Tax=Clostridium saudiense TaxID=1414720 RepID=A0ABS2FII4_9CLOT|nr:MULTISPECIES: carbohydrate ABC transporter substrate-binding protein [Clostridiaceae]MBM6820309.1 carbohydrate ABC transporter substrate-binding protein [Clostridium saudiense]